MLADQAEKQVTADGVSREQSVSYHCFVLDFYVQVIALARRRGVDLPAGLESRIIGMLGFLDRLVGEGGDLPHIGDGDEGRGLPYPCPVSQAERAESLLAAGAHLFSRPEWAREGTDLCVLPLWLFGEEGVSESPAGVGHRNPLTTLWSAGGYAFFEAPREDGTPLQLIFDVGGLGYLPNAAHEHADALSIVVKVGRHLVLGDPGTGLYTGDPALRDELRATASHSTVTIDGLDQADILDTFKWLNLPHTELLAWSASADFDYAAAAHDGYARLRRPARHRREVLFGAPHRGAVVPLSARCGCQSRRRGRLRSAGGGWCGSRASSLPPHANARFARASPVREAMVTSLWSGYLGTVCAEHG
jgi:hypothetical protein